MEAGEWEPRTAGDPWPWPEASPPGAAVHVCRARLDGGGGPALQRLLSPDEKARADRFRAREHRRRFVVARAYLREMLGNLLGVPAAEVMIEIGPHGKPLLAAHHDTLHFNISHCGDVALYAFSREQPVGVDVEKVRDDVAWEQLAARFYAPEEAQALVALAPDRGVEGFFACWARKEAVLKATGTGLSSPLRDVVVPVDPDVPLDGSRPTGGWTIVDLGPEPGHRAALALRGPATVKTWTWSSVHSAR